MNVALLGPALGAAAAIYFLLRGLRILKTGTATLADAFPFGGIVLFWLRGIHLKGWSARLAAMPLLIFSFTTLIAGGWMIAISIGHGPKGPGTASRETITTPKSGWLDSFKSSLTSLTGKFSPPAPQKKPAVESRSVIPATVRDLTEAEFPYFKKTPDKLAVVLFYREGDGPSRMVQQELEGVALEFPGRVEMGRIDVERFPKLAAQEDIRGVPDIRFFRNGKRVDQVTGPAPTEMLRRRFQQLAPPPPPAPIVAAAEPEERLPSGPGSITRMKKSWVPPGMQRW